MELYVFRHGESVGNRQRLFSGWSQMPLTDTGEEQARALKKRVEGIAFDLAFSSDLRRAVQTAQIVLPQVTPAQDPDLREVDVGVLTEKGVDACTEKYGDAVWHCRTTRDFTYFGGEKSEDLCRRAARFLRRVASLQAERVAVFTHEGLMKGMLCAVLDAQIHDLRFRHDNCAYSVFTYRPEKGWQMLKWNV